MPHFVLLYHDCPPHYQRPSHWDLMLESGETMRTWALAQLPCDWEVAHAQTALEYPQCPPIAENSLVAAEALGEHRREYITYQGSLGGDRGSVVRVAAGSYDTLRDTPGNWQIRLAGNISGRINLKCLHSEGTEWILTCLSGD